VETMTLSELIHAKAAELRLLDNGAGEMMAAALDGLARDVEFFRAATPEQYAELLAVWDELRASSRRSA
jgi:hypothetical protein